MRARAGDPPRTMTQKILAGRSDDPNLSGELVRVKVDQVVLTRELDRTVSGALELGAKRCAVEVGIAYETTCVTTPADLPSAAQSRALRDALSLGLLVARPGIGFPAAVHVERFGSPARLAVTDDPRLGAVGGAGMLSLVVSPSQLAEALTTGSVAVRPPRSVQVLLSGRIRPFVCVRDVGLELIRRGLRETVRRVDEQYRAPVVIEFAGPSARLLSVAERAVLSALAPSLGASAAVFVSDEKTEVYLRDQRRSKAHRSLLPDPGAPCDDVISVDLSAVDPLVMDEAGEVRPVRELAGKVVNQVILGGDSGATLRDLLAAAALLKSKRVPARLELLLAPPSRQSLEVLAQSGALVDLIATGARLLEPDPRLMSGELYPPPPGGVSLRTFDPEPALRDAPGFVVASAETLAYAVATGAIGDPRSFKRPVRITVPRLLPTDDVLIVRKGKGKSKDPEAGKATPSEVPALHGFNSAAVLPLVSGRHTPLVPSALVLESLDDVRWLVRKAADVNGTVRAVIAPHIPSGSVQVLAGLGIVALSAAPEALAAVKAQASLSLPAPGDWDGKQNVTVSTDAGAVEVVWLAVGAERDWTTTGTTRQLTAPRR
jgi:aconitate hydratase